MTGHSILPVASPVVFIPLAVMTGDDLDREPIIVGSVIRLLVRGRVRGGISQHRPRATARRCKLRRAPKRRSPADDRPRRSGLCGWRNPRRWPGCDTYPTSHPGWRETQAHYHCHCRRRCVHRMKLPDHPHWHCRVDLRSCLPPDRQFWPRISCYRSRFSGHQSARGQTQWRRSNPAVLACERGIIHECGRFEAGAVDGLACCRSGVAQKREGDKREGNPRGQRIVGNEQALGA